MFHDDKEKIIETGKILYANMILSGQKNELYYFDDEKFDGHYDKNGKSAKKALMKTPINGARLSSSFGMRKHPILGFNKMHKGTDFAAKEGTPVMASGDGKIIRARWCGGGGNCVKIKHNSTSKRNEKIRLWHKRLKRKKGNERRNNEKTNNSGYIYNNSFRSIY